MSKDFDTLEINTEVIETITTEVTTLDDLSLMLIGGGEYVIAV
jgi:hypothetical protein